jgi:hypothetical protein
MEDKMGHICITYKIRKSYTRISFADPKWGDLKNLGIDGRMTLEETLCKGVDFNNLLRTGMVQPLVNLWILHCIEAFLRDMMKSDLHTMSMHIPTLVVMDLKCREADYSAIVL